MRRYLLFVFSTVKPKGDWQELKPKGSFNELKEAQAAAKQAKGKSYQIVDLEENRIVEQQEAPARAKTRSKE